MEVSTEASMEASAETSTELCMDGSTEVSVEAPVEEVVLRLKKVKNVIITSSYIVKTTKSSADNREGYFGGVRYNLNI